MSCNESPAEHKRFQSSILIQKIQGKSPRWISYLTRWTNIYTFNPHRAVCTVSLSHHIWTSCMHIHSHSNISMEHSPTDPIPFPLSLPELYARTCICSNISVPLLAVTYPRIQIALATYHVIFTQLSLKIDSDALRWPGTEFRIQAENGLQVVYNCQQKSSDRELRGGQIWKIIKSGSLNLLDAIPYPTPYYSCVVAISATILIWLKKIQKFQKSKWKCNKSSMRCCNLKAWKASRHIFRVVHSLGP